jgi:hypothetical protein
MVVVRVERVAGIRVRCHGVDGFGRFHGSLQHQSRPARRSAFPWGHQRACNANRQRTLRRERRRPVLGGAGEEVADEGVVVMLIPGCC